MFASNLTGKQSRDCWFKAYSSSWDSSVFHIAYDSALAVPLQIFKACGTGAYYSDTLFGNGQVDIPCEPYDSIYIHCQVNNIDSSGFCWSLSKNIGSNRPPENVGNSVEQTMLRRGDSIKVIDLSTLFYDPNGDRLTFSIDSVRLAEENAFDWKLYDQELEIIRQVETGEGTIYLSARDYEYSVSGKLSVLITDSINMLPQLIEGTDTIIVLPSMNYYKSIDLDKYFYDPKGGVLQYNLESAPAESGAYQLGNKIFWATSFFGITQIKVCVTDQEKNTVQFILNVNLKKTFNLKPFVVCDFPDLYLNKVNPKVYLDLENCFFDRDSKLGYYYTVDKIDQNIDVSFIQNTIFFEKTGTRGGQINVTISAYDEKDTVSIDFMVFSSGLENKPPVMIGIIKPIVLDQGFFTYYIHPEQYFIDPEGEELTYTLRSINNCIKVDSDNFEIVEMSGTCTDFVEIEATDPSGGRTVCMVPVQINANLPPYLSKDMHVIYLTNGFGTDCIIELDELFINPEQSALTYTLFNTDTSVVSLYINDNNCLVATKRGVGQAVITIRANDGTQSKIANITIYVMKAGNRIPYMSHDQKLIAINSYTDKINLDAYFTDPDHDKLSYKLISQNNKYLVLDSSTICFSQPFSWITSVELEISDGNGGQIEDQFNIVVKKEDNIAPQLLMAEKKANSCIEKPKCKVPLDELFFDPDGDELYYIVSVENKGIAKAKEFAESVSIEGLSLGSTDIYVTAFDKKGGSANSVIHYSFTEEYTPNSIDEPKNTDNHLIIYPNPATESVWIGTGSSGWVSLHNMEGNTVLNEYIYSGTNQIRLIDLPDGIYLLEFKGKTATISVK